MLDLNTVHTMKKILYFHVNVPIKSCEIPILLKYYYKYCGIDRSFTFPLFSSFVWFFVPFRIISGFFVSSCVSSVFLFFHRFFVFCFCWFFLWFSFVPFSIFNIFSCSFLLSFSFLSLDKFSPVSSVFCLFFMVVLRFLMDFHGFLQVFSFS